MCRSLVVELLAESIAVIRKLWMPAATRAHRPGEVHAAGCSRKRTGHAVRQDPVDLQRRTRHGVSGSETLQRDFALRLRDHDLADRRSRRGGIDSGYGIRRRLQAASTRPTSAKLAKSAA